jgi:hypothetical protein
MDQEILDEIQGLFEFDKAKMDIILHKLISDDMITGEKIDIAEDVYNDTHIDAWASSLPILSGSKILMRKLIKHPINNKDILEKRQNTQITYEPDIELLKEYENDILWIFKIAEEINDNSAIHILFPSSFIINYMNYIEQLLDFYHVYKIYIIPMTSLLYPITTFLAPYYYLNRYLNMNVSFQSYVEIFWNIIKYSLQSSGNIKADLARFFTVFFYVAIYLYNMYQTFEISMFLYDTKQKLHSKMKGLLHFVKHSQHIMAHLPVNIVSAFFHIKENYHDIKLHNTMTDIYKLWKDDELKEKLASLLKTIYAVDVIDSINKLYLMNDWCQVSYVTDKSVLWDAKNPILDYNQVSNPVNLAKNIIITGPNAGGKTTYVKTILSNIILGQTFGITYSTKSNLVLYDTISSFMRISDVLGSKSYFEAEAEYCLNMIKKAVEISSKSQRGLFLMDEPMHSTPPTEGVSTAYAVVEYISKLSGISLIITTHFHKLVILEELYPDKFINLSVDAIPRENESGFIFPYKINRGHSYLCIAIELLDAKEFPSEVIANAIKMKNKICSDFNK